MAPGGGIVQGERASLGRDAAGAGGMPPVLGGEVRCAPGKTLGIADAQQPPGDVPAGALDVQL